MPRFPKPWSKKRGKRILGHALAGEAGELAFYAGLFLVGVFGFSLVLINEVAPESVSQVPTDALSTGLGTWVFGILSLASMITGGVTLLYRLARIGASSERRSAIAKMAGSIDMIGPTIDDAQALPSVPKGSAITESPGERLTYRLAAEKAKSGIAGPATLALLWSSAWLVLLAVVVSGFWNGQPRWYLAVLLVPFAMISVWSFRFFLNQFRQFAGIGPTIVEISSHPLTPGGQYDLFISQSGRLSLKRLTVLLTCEEETFYRQGTDVRVDRHEAIRQVICKERNVAVDPQGPWEQQLRIDLPDNVMHSFVGTHNAIRWKVVVSGESQPWPSFLPKFSRRRSSPGLVAEAQPAVNVTLCNDDGLYRAGGELSAKWRISRVPLDEVQGVEVSVLWHTEGKGDEDLHVHHFQRLAEHQLRRTGLADEQVLHCVLPATAFELPWSPD